MRKPLFLLSLALSLVVSSAMAQTIPCYTDEMHRAAIKEKPYLADAEKRMNENIKRSIAAMDFSSMRRTTAASGWDTIHVPVVVHIVHSYGGVDYLTDNQIYNLIKRMNDNYNLFYDTTQIVQPFRKYLVRARIYFHLATKDPLGNPTTGITRDFSYLTYGGDDQGKINQWSPTNYYNIWFENVIGKGNSIGTILAYAQFPSSDYDAPGYSGVICAAPYIDDGSTLEHESGHYLSLYHTWNDNGRQCAQTPLECGNDEVDDTPPTPGHFSTCGAAQLRDTFCNTNHFKIYPDITGADSLADYPDTANTQNMMDYSSCTYSNFTKGQVIRMRATLQSSVGSRDSLSTPYNLAITGALNRNRDLSPIPDYYVTNGATTMQYFTCPGTALRFTNKSWRDTVTKVEWTFSNGASTPTNTMTGTAPNGVSYNTYVSNSFTDSGWVKVTVKATGNNTTPTTTEFKNVYVASPTATPAADLLQEFTEISEAKGNWPLFNYYNNDFKWEYAFKGYLDGHCLRYRGYEYRALTFEPCPKGTPYGDYDDFFTEPIDLTGYSGGICYLDFFSSGASRTSISTDIRDTLEISYSKDKAKSWTKLTNIAKGSLCNKGVSTTAYEPTSPSDWIPQSIKLPDTLRNNYVVFRFRYKPNVVAPPSDATKYWSKKSTGNNFYIDRMTFSRFPAGVNEVVAAQNAPVVVAPNPTQGDALVVLKNGFTGNAKITVTDITGKTVFTASADISAANASITIPQSAIAVKGIYMVHTSTGSFTNTQKLVVN
ncbi:MAG: T9SS C-terminal target domain-containing protein [Chitinophagia bacterium]|nr:T9SS C-terminal target domain-containing protein [Chitinophagia bacterium]